MWQHQAGRIDFEGPLLQLWQRGWQFRGYAPTAHARDGGRWSVVGINGEARVRVDHPERTEAWAEAVRLALSTTVERGPLAAVPRSGTMGDGVDDPSTDDEERARLREVGWSFVEHPTAQASGRDGWVVNGILGERRIQVSHDDRSVAWGAATVLAAATAGSASPPETPPPDRDE